MFSILAQLRGGIKSDFFVVIDEHSISRHVTRVVLGSGGPFIILPTPEVQWVQ
jgi:hypothetical protein